MIVVIIAGGSGTRLWPLSTKKFPKQLLSLTNDRSMLQNTFERASKISDKIYVIPDSSHAEHAKKQLPGLSDDHFLVEPTRRGTANCVVAALAYLSKKHGCDEPVAFIHADHHIRDVNGFALSFQAAGEISSIEGAITLIGIEPTFASTGYGYIEKNKELENYKGAFNVKSFKEKPNFLSAQKYFSKGEYLWNCGYFVGSINTFLSEIKKYSPELENTYDKLQSFSDIRSVEYGYIYKELKDQVIDIALIEKAKNLVVLQASFDWVDVGNFNDLHGAIESDEKKNYIRGKNIYIDEVENSYIRNEETKPIAIIGLDNIAIVNTAEGILIARKDLSHRVGEIAKKIQK